MEEKRYKDFLTVWNIYQNDDEKIDNEKCREIEDEMGCHGCTGSSILTKEPSNDSDTKHGRNPVIEFDVLWSVWMDYHDDNNNAYDCQHNFHVHIHAANIT